MSIKTSRIVVAQTNQLEESHMLFDYSISEFVGLQGAEVDKVEENESMKIIHVSVKREEQICPCCGTAAHRVHDYYNRTIKDLPCFEKKTRIIYHLRRYRCSSCGKRFAEKAGFIGRYRRMTRRMVAAVISRLAQPVTYTHVAGELDIHPSTVIRLFDNIRISRPAELPECVAIDEFKGNTGGEKYNCILTDPENHKVLDILPKRYDYYLSHYFTQYPRDNRLKVKYFVSDMWKVYSDTAGIYMKNAMRVVDRYHWIRQAEWALENERKNIQKRIPPSERKYYKRSKSLLNKPEYLLTEDERLRVNIMLERSPDLFTAYFYFHDLRNILKTGDVLSRQNELKKWISSACRCGVHSVERCSATFFNWEEGIMNSLATPLSNGFTEGCNNKIKVLKRNAYGFRNFERFRNRVLYMFS